ncbi:MAG: hypothetical protein M3P95_01985 [Actinomycetota bacterium]|nr:hypothetical protein [Actinomycetota bacterium]
MRRLPGRLVGETVDRDRFAEVLCELARLAEEDPSRLKEAPVAAPVRRLDEARAARSLTPRWRPGASG